MKTTIEIHGYQIVIEESEGGVSVSALKDDETVEEFTLEAEGQEGEESQEGEEGLHAFGEEGAQEDDFDGAEGEEDFEEEGQEGEEDFEEEEIEDVEEEGKLESFKSFIKKRK